MMTTIREKWPLIWFPLEVWVEVEDADDDADTAVPEDWALAEADASGSKGSKVPVWTAETTECVLDRDSEVEVVTVDSVAEVVIVDPEPEKATLVGSTMEVLVLYTGVCAVGVGVRVEVSPPEEDVDVAEDVTAFFCAKPITISIWAEIEA